MATPAAVLNILVTANTGQATAQLGRLQGQLQATQATAKRSSAQTAASIGRGAARAATAVGAIGVGSIVAAAKFEDAFADVRKTVDATEPQFARLEKGIREMAKQIPVSAQELAHLAGEAGALGVKTEDLLGFTRVAADLGVATDLSASAAANALARLANIMDTKGEKAFSRLGATLVDLGNKGASTESEISEMALRIAGAGQTIGLTESQVLGFSAALANVGIRAEAGGSSISKVMLTMQDAVAQGGAELQAFAEVSGLSTDAFAKKFGQDAPAAIDLFTKGLDRVKDSGGSVVQTLEAVGLNEIRTRDALLRLGGATGEVTKAQNIANKAWGENSALAEEANKRYATTSSQFEILKNRVFDLGISFGQDLLPKVNEAMKALGEGRFDDAIENFGDLGADMAKKAIGAFVKAWWDSGVLTKLFLTAGFIRLVGGRGALGKVGMAIAEPIMGHLGRGIRKGGGAVRQALRGVVTKISFWAQYGAMAAAEWVGSAVGRIRSSKMAGRLRGFFRKVALQMGKVLAATTAAAVIVGEGIGGAAASLTGLLRGRLIPRMRKIGRVGGKAFGIAFIAGFVLALPELAKQLRKHLPGQGGDTDLGGALWKDSPFSIDLPGPHWAKGGFVPEPKYLRRGGSALKSRGTDTVPAMLTPGEFVIRREAVKRVGTDVLAAINKGKGEVKSGRTHFQTGGVVRGARKARGAVTAGVDLGEGPDNKLVESTRKVVKATAKVMREEFGKGHKEVGKETEKFTKNHGKAWEKVRDVAKKATQSFRKDTSDDFKKTHREAVDATGRLKKGAGRDFEATAKDASRRTQKMRESVSDDFAKTRAKSLDSTQKMRKGVGSGYAGMATAAGEGMRRLAKMTNNALKALGVKKVDFHIGAEGKQRGGHITASGVPSVGDHIPAMLEKDEFVVNSKASKKHRALLEHINFKDAARFQKGGAAGGRAGMTAMVAEANKFERRGFPYVWGGGHGSFGIQPVDCSGAVSQVLHAAGLLSAPMTSGALMNWGKPGKGPLTVYTSPSHVVMSLNGKFFGTSGSNPGDGAGWIEGGSGSLVPGGVTRTMDVAGGVAKKVKRMLLKGSDGPLKDMGQATLDKVRGAANRYIDKKTPAGRFGGGQALKEFGGGAVSRKEMRQLLRANNLPDIMGWVAGAESLWNPRAHNVSGASGLWQIMMPLHQGIVKGNVFDPNVNARAAATLYRQSGLTPWAESEYKGAIPGGWSTKVGAPFQQGGVVDRTGVKHQAIAAPFVGSFDKGGEVAQTGLGLLHKGEHVVAMKKGGFVAGGGGAGGGGPDAQGGGRRGVKAFGVERVRQMREKVGKIVGKAIPYLEESIGIAESLAGLTTSPGGSELSKGEVREQMKLQQKLLATMRKTLNISKRAMGIIDRTIKRIEDSVKNLGRKIAREDKKTKPDKKRIAGWQRDIARRTEAISGLASFRPAFTETITEMSGLTGRGGRIFDTTLAIKELRAQGKPQAIGIEDLLAFAEAMRYGAFNRQLGTAGNIPTFAKGGVHRGGLALVGEKGPEVVQMPPAQVFPTGTAPAMAPPVVEITFADGMGWLKDFVSVEIKNREQRERGRWRRDNVAR